MLAPSWHRCLMVAMRLESLINLERIAARSGVSPFLSTIASSGTPRVASTVMQSSAADWVAMASGS